MREFMKLDRMTAYFAENGAFLATTGGGQTNVMTISWGMFGQMWNREMVMVLVRPQRYTKHIIDVAEDFTVSVPLGALARELAVCGSRSGAELDKSKVVEFIGARAVKSPVVKGCGAYYECRIIYRDRLYGEKLPDEIKQFYRDGDYHYLYFGEVVASY